MSPTPSLTARCGGLVLRTTAALGGLCLLALAAAWLFDARVLVVTSGSMAPAIDVGSAALVQRVDAGQAEVGDVVSVADQDGERVLHRIVSTRLDAGEPGGRELVLKGDANETADPTAYRVGTVDRAVVTLPGAGYFLAALASPLGLLVLICVVGAAAWATARAPASSARHRERSRRSRRGAQVAVWGLLGLGLALPLMVPWVEGTAAAFTDEATAASGTLGTTTLVPPDSISCSGGGAISTQITLSWPHKDTAYDYQVVIRDAGGTVRQTYLVTGTGAVGSTQSRVIPGGLLGSIGLGTFYTTAEIRSQLKVNAAWQSSTMRTWTYREVVVVLGLSIYCS